MTIHSRYDNLCVDYGFGAFVKTGVLLGTLCALGHFAAWRNHVRGNPTPVATTAMVRSEAGEASARRRANREIPGLNLAPTP